MMARRLNGTGSVFYMKKRKRWVWVGNYYNALGEKKKKWISATNRKSLKEKMDAFTAQLDNNTLKSDMTLEVWVKQWLEIVEQPMVCENTYLWYIYILKYMNFTCNIEDDGKQYIQKDLGKEKLNLITPIKVQELLRNLRYFGNKNNKKLATRTVNSFRRVLGMALKYAMENDLIKSNPVLKTKPFKIPKDSIVVLNEQEIKDFLDMIKNGKYFKQYTNKKIARERPYYKEEFYALVYLGFASGMRISEICSLRWSDINFEKNFLQVRWVLKTENSERKISLDENTIEILKQFKDFQTCYANDYPDFFYKDNDLVFTTGIGKKIDPDNFRYYFWYKMVETANLPTNFRIHCMRHTHATLLLKNGVNIKVISKRLGHSTIEFTLKTYAHVIEEMEDTAANTWSEIMKNKNI